MKKIIGCWLLIVLMVSLLVIGCGGYQAPEPTPALEPAPTVSLTIEGTEWSLTPATITVNKGDTVRITFRNVGAARHNLTIAQLGVATATISGGSTETVEFVAEEAGTFAFYCSVYGHRGRGMEGTVIVE